MKKVILGIIALLILVPFTTLAKDKVKVYVFEAGGCPACEAQIEYLESLEGYNKTFEVVREELYVDHVDWAQGKDYDLGVKVANTFKEAGFDAAYNATPLVVVSDIYAANGYNDSLETVINEAADKGDKDAVKCIEKGKKNCVKSMNADSADSSSGSSSNAGVIAITLISALLVAIVYLVKSSMDKKEILEAIKKRK